MKTIPELKEIIVDLEVRLARANIPQGNCPYAYYPIIEQEFDCNDISCSKCKIMFFDKYKNKIRRMVEKM